MNESISGIISILATFQLLFASLFLITHRKGNKRNNRLLGLIFLLFSISLADFSLRINGILFPNPVWHLIDEGFFFLYGPLLYLYVKGVVFLILGKLGGFHPVEVKRFPPDGGLGDRGS